MENSTIAFIGCGNMSRSLIGGLIANGVKQEKLIATDMDSEQRDAIAKQFNIATMADNNEAVDKADVILIAVKPQVMHSVINEIADSVKDTSKLIISIAAGVRLESISGWLGNTAAVVRVMPNTPALIQAGAAALYANEHTSETQKNIAEAMMRSVGSAIWLDSEEQMDAVTALSGSGPAYFFYFMEAMEKAAIDMGLSEEHARLLTIETAVGASKMALLSSYDPAELRQQVTSPGGTTEQAINSLTQGKLDELVQNAMEAAKQRSIELSKEFGK
ncbi:MAG: pyrroline-5-carboxylate reductase [Proteobacteria bacterium]|nr:pyrroline-5-carboxylate reductase [Pseudomonadota bacterium]NOG60617.1 pyrroline-5-carboxylate reductase [Pseudomonadota bacterium]